MLAGSTLLNQKKSFLAYLTAKWTILLLNKWRLTVCPLFCTYRSQMAGSVVAGILSRPMQNRCCAKSLVVALYTVFYPSQSIFQILSFLLNF